MGIHVMLNYLFKTLVDSPTAAHKRNNIEYNDIVPQNYNIQYL